MKYVIIIPDGAADFPIKELGNKTPLGAAKKPNIDYIAKNGKSGIMQTCFHKLPVGSIIANLGILGYNPYLYHPGGRASFEALARGVKLKNGDVAFRCNLISLEDGKIKDFTAGNISDEDALNIVNNFKIKEKDLEIHFGLSYRTTLVVRNAKFAPHEIHTFEPHMHRMEEIKDLLIQPKEEGVKESTEMLNKFLLDSKEQFKELNKKFNTKADMFWLWSPSFVPNLPDFKERTGIRAGAISGMDFLKGIAVSAGITTENIPGTTGYIDTNIEGKLNTAKKYLKDHDLVCIHLNSPDEEAHKRNPHTKTKAIEIIDEKIVGPILNHLKENFGDDFRIAVLPDHYTLTKDGTHNNRNVPFCVYGKGIEKDEVENFNEQEIENFVDEHVVSYNFLKDFIKQ